MSIARIRWRSFKQHKPPRGRQLLIVDRALRGQRDVLDDGTRLGYFDGHRLRAAGDEPGDFSHWLPYAPAPRFNRVDVRLSGEMLALLDRLRTAYRRGELFGAIDPAKFQAKLPTCHALARRGLLRLQGGRFFLPQD